VSGLKYTLQLADDFGILMTDSQTPTMILSKVFVSRHINKNNYLNVILYISKIESIKIDIYI
jgi:hypothetical protein